MSTKKIIVILGPTATGKSDLAVKIALHHKGEIISADSRQVYRDLNLGTGKITKKEMRGIRHHLLDIASPRQIFSVSKWQKMATAAMTKIFSQGKVPIICGGTGLYIQSIVDNMILPKVAPNWQLRKELEKKSAAKLFKKLQKIDPKRASNIDRNNPARLLRAIEIARALGNVPPLKFEPEVVSPSPNATDLQNVTSDTPRQFLQIGLNLSSDELKKRIHNRLLRRIKNGMLAEAKRLHKNGMSYKRISRLGLEYKAMALHFSGKISKKEMLEMIEKLSWQYARRQMTWFKRDRRIRWFSSASVTDRRKIHKLVVDFLKSEE